MRPPAVESDDLERFLGRYGMLAIAVLAAVAAVGTFLNYAINHGWLRLDPPARVLIGLAAAGGLGIWGLRLRERERSFGSTIVGLALVIVHVCGFAAGPGLHIVPSWVAFVGTAFVSWALAMFAHGQNDEPLWCVGFGGAAIAPFVTGDGHGSVFVLLIYGLLVQLPSCFAISHRQWPIGWGVFYAVSALFTFGGADLARRGSLPEFLAVFAFPVVIAIGGVVPFAPDSRKRGTLRWLVAVAAIVGLLERGSGATELLTLSAVFFGAFVLWLIVLDRHASFAQSSVTATNGDNPALLDWIDAAVIPLAFVSHAMSTYARFGDRTVVFAAAAPVLLLFAWRRVVGPLRDASALATVSVATALIAALPLEEPTGRIAALVALGVAVLAAYRLNPSLSWLASGVVLLLISAAMSMGAMLQQHAYTFTPFITEPSLTALVLLAAWIFLARSWPWLRSATRTAMGDSPEWTYADAVQPLLRAASLAPWVWAFTWGLIELSMAFSPSTSTFLLVVYFASTGVANVAAGRARHSARLRQVGLGLALVAACTAVYGARTYFDFGAQIAAYLVTSAFLLGIAYWYRRTGSDAASQQSQTAGA
jgi:hypothetical protein